MEFLQLIETYRSEHASRERLFDEDGFVTAASIRKRANYNQLLHEAMGVLKSARGSRFGMLRFEEAMNTQDFPLLMGDVLDRQLLGTYMECPQTWQNYCRRAKVQDFRTVNRLAVDGAEGVLPSVGEQGDYLPQVVGETKYTYAVTKYGRTLNWSWESWINDDLDALGSSSPARLARASRRSEEKFATGLFVDANGPHASLYTTGNANKVTSNPVLSITALQTAWKVLGAMRDADNEPILIDVAELVVPPALEIVAQNILNATVVRSTATSGGATNNELEFANWMRTRVRLSVNPYIPIVASSANGDTSWFLFASPSVGRPALEMGFLKGHEAPALFQKISNQQRLGGSSSPIDGDFEKDATAFKVRHVFGGGRMDPKTTVASNGSGS